MEGGWTLGWIEALDFYRPEMRFPNGFAGAFCARRKLLRRFGGAGGLHSGKLEAVDVRPGACLRCQEIATAHPAINFGAGRTAARR